MGRSGRWRGWWGWLAGLLLLGAVAGCGGRGIPRSVSERPSATVRPSATEGSRGTATAPSPAPMVSPSPVPSPTVAFTPTATPEPVFFVGECTAASTDLCLRSWAWVNRGGDRVLRYIFFHARYPAALKVRINGFQLACAPLAERQQEGAVVCYGKPLGSLRGVVRLTFAYFLPDGRVLEGRVPAEVRPALRYIFPVWFPPTPTPEE